MCLVEVEKSPKPVASCAMPANPGMNIKTNTPLVKKAREGVMEFLLANHPLDCPICDQGGECDLQDQAMVFGSDRSRFTEAKRTVVDKNLGPLVKTVMTRCIHCTRCVRFAKEVAGIEDLGVTGRGRDAEIGTYVQKTMQSELSGNVVDLCPVGALTSKPTAFTYRSWELRSTDSVDVSDALGSNIRVDARGSEVMRVMPRLNDDINQEWISDKTRYQFDGLRYQRLVSPMVKSAATGRLEVCDWPTALATAADALRGAASGKSGKSGKSGDGACGIRAIAGKLADVESMVLLKDLMNALGCEDVRHENFGDGVQADVRSSYLFSGGLRSVDDADAVMLIGTNPRKEAPVLNARIRAQAVYGGKVGVVGDASMDLTYPHEHLSEGVDDLAAHAKFFEVRLLALVCLLSFPCLPPSHSRTLPPSPRIPQGAVSPMIIVGSSVFRYGSYYICRMIMMRRGWSGRHHHRRFGHTSDEHHAVVALVAALLLLFLVVITIRSTLTRSHRVFLSGTPGPCPRCGTLRPRRARRSTCCTIAHRPLARWTRDSCPANRPGRTLRTPRSSIC